MPESSLGASLRGKSYRHLCYNSVFYSNVGMVSSWAALTLLVIHTD